MKRCPQCEFIYEDEQGRCDMDGQMLVYDQALSVTQAPAPAKTSLRQTSSVRSVALPAIAGLILAGLIFTGYYASIGLSNSAFDDRVAQGPSQLTDINTPVKINSSLGFLTFGFVSAVQSNTEPLSEPDPAMLSDEPDAATDKPAHAHRARVRDRFAIARTVPPLPRLRPLPRLPEARPLVKKPGVHASVNPSQQTRKAYLATPKKESKLGTFLKKTGRVLTKPFKL